MRAVVADDVVAAHRFGGLHDAEREIVVVEHRLAAGVLGEGVQRVLRSLEVRGGGIGELAGEHADAAGRAPRRVAERSRRHEAARVDRVERDVRANRGVDRGAQLRLVVGAVEAQAAGEVDQRLLLGQRPQHRDRRLQRGQLTIGVEDVELGVVLSERRACLGMSGIAVAVLIVAEDQNLDDPRAAPRGCR